jgi:hypothetical protein
MRSQVPPLRKHATAGFVAVLVVALSLGQGGYSAGMRAAIAFAAWATVAGGLALGTFPRSRIPASAVITGGMLGGLALLSGLSVAWASDNGAAIEATVLVAAYLGIFALIVCVAREGDARTWLIGLALGIVGVGLLAILSRLVSSLPGGDEEIARLLPSARGRLSYPIGYWNGTAALLAVGVVLMTWFGASARTLLARTLAVAAIPMLGLGIYLASSRGGFLALVLGLVVLVGVGPRRPALLLCAAIGAVGTGLAIALASGQTSLLDATGGPDANNQGFELLGATVACMFFTGVVRIILDGVANTLRPSPLLARISLAMLVLAGIVALIVADPGKRFDEFKSVPTNEGAGKTDFVASHLSSGSGSGRWQFWGVAVDAFGDQPVHGIGAGGYADYWNQRAPISRVTKQAHSLYLEELGNLGPLGFMAVLGFLVVPIIAGSRGRSSFPHGEPGVLLALIAAGALSAGIDWTFQIPVVFGVVVAAAALLTGPSLVAAGGPERSSSPPGRAWRLAIVLIGSAVVLLAGDQFLGQRSLDASQAAARDDDLARAADEARDAVALSPWAAKPRLQLALVQESAGDLERADESIQGAIDRAEDDWSLWLVRARLATLEGRVGEGRQALAEARRLNPRAPVFNTLSGPLGG